MILAYDSFSVRVRESVCCALIAVQCVQCRVRGVVQCVWGVVSCSVLLCSVVLRGVVRCSVCSVVQCAMLLCSVVQGSVECVVCTAVQCGVVSCCFVQYGVGWCTSSVCSAVQCGVVRCSVFNVMQCAMLFCAAV